MEKVENAPPDIKALVISSHGGASQTALEVAKIIKERGYSITVFSHCISACSELLLPAASSIVFYNKPFIAYHGNTVANAYFVATETAETKTYCSLMHSLKVRLFYLDNGIPSDTWREQYKRLEIENISIEPVEGYDCVKAEVQTKHELWYPNSQQLRDVFGLKFSGDVCADFKDCYEDKLSSLYSVGASLAVGETIFTVSEP